MDNDCADDTGAPLELGWNLARDIMTGAQMYVHAVPICGKMKTLFDERPSLQQIIRFTNDLCPVPVSPLRSEMQKQHVDGGTSDGHIASDAIPVESVLDWVAATSFNKDIKDSDLSAEAWAKLLTRNRTESSEELLESMTRCGRDLIRKARVRLDCMCMLLWRAFFSLHGLTQELQINLTCDASPQGLGQELFAAAFDYYLGDHHWRRTFPIVQQVGAKAIGKAITSLFQIFLMFGPSADNIIHFCSRVGSILTDHGVEIKLAEMDNILPTFFKLMGIPMAHLKYGL